MAFFGLMVGFFFIFDVSEFLGVGEGSAVFWFCFVLVVSTGFSLVGVELWESWAGGRSFYLWNLFLRGKFVYRVF